MLRNPLVSGFIACLCACTLSAEPLPASVTQFFSGLNTLQAAFEQQVRDGNGELTQDSSGQMWIARPGRFRWDYLLPYRQQLIADGERFWMYDEDLEQVTVQPAADIITSTPAMLLSGSRPLDEIFIVDSSADEKTVRLLPRADESNIASVELYINNEVIERIVALDSFGNTTTFSFSGMIRNPEIEDDIFRFTPPAGTDVIGPADPSE